ncbi:MAG: ATP-dependent endonuclease, partial [Terriglobales bacterium]
YDPYVGEFFFGGRTLIVEGDTEYSAFRHVASKFPGEYRSIHIVRARGKATIVAVLKILNQFGSSFAVLHDSDLPKNRKGQTNSAWTLNERILAEYNKRPKKEECRLVASLKNFESAYLGAEARDDKPYNAVNELNSNLDAFARVKTLLDALVDVTKPLPEGCTEWHNITELEGALKAAKFLE